METEYSTSIGFKIFYLILGMGCMGVALFLFTVHSKAGTTLIYLVPVLFFCGGLAVVINQFRRKLAISDTAIAYTNIFKNTTIAFENIKGYRIGDKVIFIESNQKDTPKITINDYISLADSESMIDWLKENFKDLNDIDLVNNRNTLLNSTELGHTEEKRKKKMQVAKSIAIAYNIIGMILGFAMIFVENHVVAAYILIIYPLVGIGVIKFSYGLTKFVSDKKRSEYNSVMLGFILPVAMMLVKSLSDYDLYNYENLWLPIIAITAIIGFLLAYTGTNTNIGGITGQIVFMIIVSTMYGFGVTVQINCGFDRSEPQAFKTKVIGKYIHTGKSNSYYLKLNPWENNQAPKDVEVSHSMYLTEFEGESVNVNMKKGALNIPWFYITK